MNGLDAYGAIPVNELGAYGFVMRYVSQTSGKCITPTEYQGYLDAGKKVILVYEDDAGDGLGGANAGAAKAAIARPILASLGWPMDRPVHFAFDMPGYSWDLDTFVRCATAFASGIGRPRGMYGDVDTCTAGNAAGIKYLIQFGEGQAPGITVFQGSAFTAPWGQEVDPDESFADDFGQAPYSPEPPPPPPEEEMKAYIAAGSKGGVQIIAADCQSKIGVPSADVVTQLLATGQFIDMRTTLDHAFVDSIPETNG